MTPAKNKLDASTPSQPVAMLIENRGDVTCASPAVAPAPNRLITTATALARKWVYGVIKPAFTPGAIPKRK